MFKISLLLDTAKHRHFTGDRNTIVKKVVELGLLNQHPDAISWCNVKNITTLATIQCGSVICPVLPADFSKNSNVNYIEVEKPRNYFLNVLKEHFDKDQHTAGVAASAQVSANVKLGKNVSIGQNVVIEEGCSIGDNTRIGHNTVIFRNTFIGNHVSIGSNCTIGGAGFGYEKNDEGQYEMLPHIGNVIIEDYVEIAHNVCIDRAVLTSTILKRNVKVDNLVHIAHNVVIGENSLIIANSMIGGSTVIGNNVWVAPSASLLNKLTVGNDAVIGMGAVVIRNVNTGEIIAGNPGKPLPKK